MSLSHGRRRPLKRLLCWATGHPLMFLPYTSRFWHQVYRCDRCRLQYTAEVWHEQHNGGYGHLLNRRPRDPEKRWADA